LQPINVDVLKEILTWSRTRPSWQRDALRQLVTKRALEHSDIEELTALCKSKHGLAEKDAWTPLEIHHIPRRGGGFDVVKLSALVHHHGVNALATDQTLDFGPALTIVYGNNAAGKSGYTRILKRACRARGAPEEILGNVLFDTVPLRPSATIRFEFGAKQEELRWTDQESHDALSRVSVLDRHWTCPLG